MTDKAGRLIMVLYGPKEEVVNAVSLQLGPKGMESADALIRRMVEKHGKGKE